MKIAYLNIGRRETTPEMMKVVEEVVKRMSKKA